MDTHTHKLRVKVGRGEANESRAAGRWRVGTAHSVAWLRPVWHGSNEINTRPVTAVSHNTLTLF